MNELYTAWELPEDLVQLMRDSVVCETSGELIRLSDPERLRVEPWGVADPGN